MLKKTTIVRHWIMNMSIKHNGFVDGLYKTEGKVLTIILKKI